MADSLWLSGPLAQEIKFDGIVLVQFAHVHDFLPWARLQTLVGHIQPVARTLEAPDIRYTQYQLTMHKWIW